MPSLKLLYVFFAVLLLSACSGLSDGVVQRMEGFPDELAKERASVAEKKASYYNLKTHKEWSFFQPYLDKEKWIDSFSKANEALDVAELLYQSEIIPMLNRDDPEEDTKARVLIKRFEIQVRLSHAAALHSEKRIAFLVNVRNTLTEISQKSDREFSQLLNAQKELTTRASKTISEYAHKKDDIKKRIDELNVLVNKGINSKKVIDTQFRNKESNIDYAAFGDEAVKLSKTLVETTDYQVKTDIKFDELYRSYTKILADQKVNFFIVIGRATWCEGEYCGNGTTKHYPAMQVDDKVFEYYDAFNKDIIASMSTSWGRERFKLNVTEAAWNALGIDKRWNWSRGDDYAEYWIEKIYSNTYHRYTEIVNDRMIKGQWIKVKEDDFWHQYNNLGMAILTKPYGYYEEDALKDAQPAGMATIATPTVNNGVATGRNQYGEWRQENGRSFWHYYGMYSMFRMLTGGRYYYNDWYGYNGYGRGRPYYGRSNQYGTWGSSTYNNSRYRNSDFARRNPGNVSAARSGKVGGSRTASSVRGAGSSSRSRGPAGGGK